MYYLIASSLRARSCASLMSGAARGSSFPLQNLQLPLKRGAASIGTAARARVPLIKFIGKRQKAGHPGLSNAPAPVNLGASRASSSVVPMSEDIYALKDGAWHGRPKLSPAEIDAIISGGATSF